MIRLANVLIVDTNAGRAAALAERLGRGGYHAGIAPDAAEGMRMATAEHPDLVLIGQSEGTDPVEFGRALTENAVTADIPVVVFADQLTADLCDRALSAGLTDAIAMGCDDTELFARLRPLVRLAVMHAELRQRAQVAARFGVIARDRVEGPGAGNAAVLVIGDDAEPVTTVLGTAVEAVTCANLYEAESLLTGRNFDAAVLSFREEPESVLGFCSQVRNNPRLFNLPMVLLAGMATDPAEAYRRGATRVLPHPVDPVVLRSAVIALVRRQQLRWAIRGALNDSLQNATRDGNTGAYSRAFLDSYLAGRLEVARTQGRQLSVIFFSAPNIEGVRRQFGDDAALHLTQQVGQWITGLLRAEDLTSAFKANEFCAVLPDTPLVEAEVVMHRIAGVLAYTDFAVREVYQPVKVWVQVGCADARDDDDVDTLLRRARRDID
ncbi:diguanylate cyclase domain-containing protein [Magnetospirillum sp. UT-4]|uniref:diguanylate cyclase domain-containing protein n=1 Tax=Magnetospirillum sp. UT-4 TaxID=2681467 RepID=UPI0013818569|nr:diguanylate cyclase [Magnetospirillum sp. UT-4]CAA7616081.1 putative Response regulator/GGDEF domain protein [Magnetospirillum sp. UT-4]